MGGPDRVPSHIRDMGETVWIDFTGRCPRIPNTLKAHAIMVWARSRGCLAEVNKLQEIIFRMYFTDGMFLDSAALVSAAEEAGLPAGQAATALEEGHFEAQVRREVTDAKNAGITAVPAFYLNGKLLFSGPQSPEAFLDAMRKA